jgi:hypothetical protein
MCASRALSRHETIMIRLRLLPFCLVVCLATAAGTAAQTPPPTGAALTVVSVGPEGEIAALEEAREIRIVFSEPMLPLA